MSRTWPLLGTCVALVLSTSCGSLSAGWQTPGGDARRSGVGDPGPKSLPSIAWSHPLTRFDRLDVVGGHGVVHAVTVDELHSFRLETGKLAWTGELEPEPSSAPPTLAGGLLLVPTDWRLQALDARSGEVRWRHDADFNIRAPIAVSRGLVVFEQSQPRVNGLSLVTAVRLRNGEHAWTTRLPRTAKVGTTISGDTVFTATFGALHALSLSDGKVRWKAQGEEADPTTPVSDGQRVYLATHLFRTARLSAFDVDEGTSTWQRSFDSPWPLEAPAADSTAVYVAVHRKGLVALDARTGAELWISPADGLLEVSPVVGGELVYWGAGRRLVASRLADGEIEWEMELPDTVHALSLVGGRLLVRLDQQGVLCLL